MAGQTRDVESAELLLPSRDVAADIAFWTSAALGFRLRQIYPADDPRVAVLSGHGLRLRLDRAIATSTSTTTDTTNTNTTTTAPASSSPPGGPVIRLLCREQPPIPDGDGSRKKMEAAEAETTTLTSPSGTRVEFAPAAEEAFPTPATAHAFRVGRLLPTTTSTADADADNAEADDAGWVVGRAGMHYRDLVPSRLGGAVVASHIRIPTAGPVADGVHFHNVGFQLIFCVAGWVRLVYEDQGPPFVLAAGDCVIQPPRIRHRVLEASAGLQVVEVGVPAEHMTTLDWDMELPTPVHRPDREWDDQRFVHSRAADAVWGPWRVPGFEARDTGIGDGTRGVATVRVARPERGGSSSSSSGSSSNRAGGGGVVTSQDSDILFTFVLSGSCTLKAEGHGAYGLAENDAYTLPPGLRTSLSDLSEDLTLLEVSLPAEFKTVVYPDEKL